MKYGPVIHHIMTIKNVAKQNETKLFRYHSNHLHI